MKKFALALGVVVLGVGLLVGTGSARPTTKSASISICVLLPDTTTSVRYELYDRPYLAKAFKAAGVPATINNAQGSAQKMRSQADSCMANGAKVVLLDAIDPGSGAGITNAVVARGAKVIDYDRLVPKSKASYYVSFDNVRVGRVMANGLIAALKAKGKYGSHPTIVELNGGITDNNAKLFKQGYDGILNPLFKNGTFKKGTAGDQWTDWNAQKGLTIFEQMLARNGNKINGAIAANDGLAGAVISALKNHGLKPIPLTGQDATPTGVQYILAGWQSGTVYKSNKLESAVAAQAAINLLRGRPVKTNATVSGTKSILLTPVWVTKRNYTILFKDGFLKRSQVCTGAYAKYC